MGAHFEALDEGVLLVPLDPRYTQVGFNLISVQVCTVKPPFCVGKAYFYKGKQRLSRSSFAVANFLYKWTAPRSRVDE